MTTGSVLRNSEQQNAHLITFNGIELLQKLHFCFGSSYNNVIIKL